MDHIDPNRSVEAEETGIHTVSPADHDPASPQAGLPAAAGLPPDAAGTVAEETAAAPPSTRVEDPVRERETVPPEAAPPEVDPALPDGAKKDGGTLVAAVDAPAPEPVPQASDRDQAQLPAAGQDQPDSSEPAGSAPTLVQTAANPTAAGAVPDDYKQMLLPEAVGESPDMEEARLRALLEAVVYVTDEPLTSAQIGAALQLPKDRVDALLAALVDEYNKPHHGLTVREVAGGYKMSTKPEHHEEIRAFVKKLKPPLKLSLAALETLAVVAYKQPITAPEIMEIRGVQGAGVLKTLLERKLITAAGRKPVVGRPVLYKTTREFLIQFGLKDLSELPSLKEFEEWSRLAIGESEEEPPPAAQNAAAGEPVIASPAVDAGPRAEPETSPTAAPGQENSDASAGAVDNPPAGGEGETRAGQQDAPGPDAQSQPADLEPEAAVVPPEEAVFAAPDPSPPSGEAEAASEDHGNEPNA